MMAWRHKSMKLHQRIDTELFEIATLSLKGGERLA
jgi:hypothetical protein